MAPVYALWNDIVINYHNAALRKLVNGTRDWDFNLDGMAHYGMIPDFLQDVRNVTANMNLLNPLFASAEEYIRMWERAEAAKLKVTD